MPIAIQEHLLHGNTTLERFRHAQQNGLQGIELSFAGLHERLYEVAAALDATGLRIAAVNMGSVAGYIDVSRIEREMAIRRLQEAMTLAGDLEAEDVIFTAHWGACSLPDLMPFRSQEQLEAEMYIWFLRTVNDLGTALEVTLSMQPVNRQESAFLNTLAQAGRFCDEIKRHPAIRIAPHIYHMTQEETDIPTALEAQGELIHYVSLCDTNQQLPEQGTLDWGKIAQTLQAIAYQGWLTLSAKPSPTLPENLPAALTFLREHGLV